MINKVGLYAACKDAGHSNIKTTLGYNLDIENKKAQEKIKKLYRSQSQKVVEEKPKASEGTSADTKGDNEALENCKLRIEN